MNLQNHLFGKMFYLSIYLQIKTKQQKHINKKEADLAGENQKTPRASQHESHLTITKVLKYTKISTRKLGIKN